MIKRACISLLSVGLLSGASLPEAGPVPEKKPEPKVERKVPDAPKPESSPKSEPEAESTKPTVIPEATKPPADPNAGAKVEPEDEKALASCIDELKSMGAEFETAPRIDDGNGCGIDKPLIVKSVSQSVKLSPAGTMRCETALELARWMRDSVAPAAQTAMEKEGGVTTINQASAYVCRLRNNAATGKISEHARGNAVDIASFTFKSGLTVAIQPREEDSTLVGAFQRAVTATGCLYFSTVLDPTSDEAHENHLHFDVIERKGGYRYCR